MTGPAPGMELDVVVTAKERLAEGVVALNLRRPDGAELPPWLPGAHIDLLLDGLLPGARIRQYSLCGDPAKRDRWRIAVLREEDGSGTSRFVHDRLETGDRVRVGGPRNHFPFDPSPTYLFVAGGIGITPLLPMIRAAQHAGADWRLVYCGRDRGSMAFAEELGRYGDRVLLHPRDEHGRLDLRALLERPGPGTVLYCCGPAGLIEEVEARSGNWPAGSVHIEHFTALPAGDPGDAFEVELRESGLTVTVPPDLSILTAVEQVGITVFTSCGEGTCGTCETGVLEGVPDHRDAVLTDAERTANDCMMICVSRSRSPRLVLDL